MLVAAEPENARSLFCEPGPAVRHHGLVGQLNLQNMTSFLPTKSEICEAYSLRYTSVLANLTPIRFSPSRRSHSASAGVTTLVASSARNHPDFLTFSLALWTLDAVHMIVCLR